MTTVEHQRVSDGTDITPGQVIAARVAAYLPSTLVEQRALEQVVRQCAERPCLGRDTESHYPPVGNPKASDELQAARRDDAAMLCEGCPVARECAALELSSSQPYGVWGGYCEPDLRAAMVVLRRAGYVPPSRLSLVPAAVA